MNEPIILAGGIIFIPLAIYIFLGPSMHLRVGALMVLMLSGVLGIVGVPGLLVLLVLAFIARDANSILETWPIGKLWWCVTTAGLLMALDPSEYSVSVGAGIATAVYLSTAIRNGGIYIVAWGGFAGSLVFALRNLSSPVITVADSINGNVSMIGRRILPDLDPNATAAILLLGILFGVAVLLQARGFLVFIILVGIACIVTSIILIAARYAIVAAAISVAAFWLLSRSFSRVSLIGAIALVSGAVVLPTIGEVQSFARFAKLSGDTDSRTAIYAHWWNLIYDEGLLLGIPAAVIDAQSVAPHNAILEALAHFGLIGLIGLSITAWFVALPFTKGGWEMRIPALSILGLAMIVGLIAQYTPWLALVLLNAQQFSGEWRAGIPGKELGQGTGSEGVGSLRGSRR